VTVPAGSRRGIAAGLLAIVAGGGVGADAAAQPFAPAIDIAGSARLGAWTRSRDLDRAGPVSTASVWVRAKAALEPSQAVVVDAWGQRSAGRADDGAGRGGVRELHLRARVGERLDITAGRQIIAWGRADGINPTDVFGRRDFTRLAFDDAEQRDGVDALAATWSLDDGWSLQAVWLPRFRGDVVPLAPAPGQHVSAAPPPRRTGGAVKLDRSGAGRVDWSVSYADGTDRMPDLALAGIDADGVHTVLSHHGARTLGADFSTGVGPVVLRGEVAWSRREVGEGDAALFRKRSQLLAVLGADGPLVDGWNGGLQLFGQWVAHYRSPDTLASPAAVAVARLQAAINNQPGPKQWGLGFRLARSWRNDTWRVEFTGLHAATTSASFLRARMETALDDRWQLRLGADRYRGDPRTVFGQLRANSTVQAEVRLLF
jgi:hypothetical protein